MYCRTESIILYLTQTQEGIFSEGMKLVVGEYQRGQAEYNKIKESIAIYAI